MHERTWLRRNWRAIVALLVVALVAFTIIDGVWLGWSYTGFNRYRLFDWLGVLGVPLALVAGLIWFQQAHRQAARQLVTQQAEEERRLAEQRSRDAVLQSYLDKMQELILNSGLGAPNGSGNVYDIARARTFTVLRHLDGSEKGSVVQFLYETGLLARRPAASACDSARHNGSIELVGADLGRAELAQASLTSADLRSANLRGANLCDAYLINADLSGADLSGANLSGADLRAACLARADLSGADLSGANLSEADLSMALLREARLNGKARLYGADLRGADLSGADLSQAQLREARLTIFKYDANTRWPAGFTPPRLAVSSDQRRSS